MTLLILIALLMAPPADDPAALSQRGKQAMAAGRYDEAAAIYRNLIELVPDNPGLLMNLGLALHSSGKYSEALRQFQAVLKLHADFAPALLFSGLDYLKLGQTARAVDPLERLLRQNPRDTTALLELGDAYLTLGRNQQALERFRKLAEIAPTQPKVWQGLGMSCLALARDAMAKLPPESPEWYAAMARSKLDQQQFRAAFRLYRQALAANSNLPGAHTGIAEIYRATGHPDWAALEAAKEHPGAKSSYERYREEGLRALAKLASLPPTAEVHQLIADGYSIEGRHKDAADELRKGLNFAPGDRAIEKQLAQELWRNRDYDAAVPILERLLRAEPDSPEINHELGDSLLELRQDEKAIPLLERAVRRKPDLLPAQASLGKAYARSGRSADAISHLERALAVDEDGSLYFQLARAYEKTGDTAAAERARKEFEAKSNHPKEEDPPITGP